ncbi:MAG: 2-amino-4-hydroxy-6-hydroxymethyldihydropteridine diphosphokinase [Bacteroidia bacterium]
MDTTQKNEALILLGANLGDIKQSFNNAIIEIKQLGVIKKKSSLYVSPSWGFKAPDFINQAIMLETELTPFELLEKLLSIEEKMGRKRMGEGYQSRTIDLDIILIKDTTICSDKLTVPHLKMHERKFVLVPCNEIASNWHHPILKKSINELLKNCEDSSNPKKL